MNCQKQKTKNVFLQLKTTMGGAQSVQKAQKNIAGTHSDIDNLVRAIQDEGNAAVDAIEASEWNKQDALCEKLAYQYITYLKNHFPKEQLEGAAIQLGLMVPNEKLTGNLTTQKTQICKRIADMYTWKIELIRKLQEEMSIEGGIKACFAREREIYQKLSLQLTAQKDINQEKWGDAYKRMYKFNKDIKKRYATMKGLIDKIKAATAITSSKFNPLHRDITTLAKDVDKVIADSRQMCDRAIDIDLREVRNLEAGAAGQGAPARNPARAAPRVPGNGGPAAVEAVTVTMVYDFNAIQDGDLTVTAGEVLELVSDGGDWITVKKADGQQGLVPKNYTDMA